MNERIELEGSSAQLMPEGGRPRRLPLLRFLELMGERIVSGRRKEALFDGVRFLVEAGPVRVFIVELPPGIHALRWAKDDSPDSLFDPERYEVRALATPYVVLKIPFVRNRLHHTVELFYRRSPLERVTDELLWPNLRNVTPDAYGCRAWLCTIGMRASLGVMEEGCDRPLSIREQVDHLIERSVIRIEGEEADLLEVTDPNAYLTNAHPVQAYKVLQFRGLHLGLPPERCVAMDELTLHADLDAETFRLVDASGRRVLPVHLSSRRDAALATILRFLLVFGPGETRGVFPFPSFEKGPEVTSYNRLTCGVLVLHRQRWDVPVAEFRDQLKGLPELMAYQRIQAWRQRLKLPPIGYYRERTYSGGVKPQFVDFTSPSLCRLFRFSLRKHEGDSIRFEEALPAPRDFPLDGLQRRRGVELLIDSLAIRTPSGNGSVGC